VEIFSTDDNRSTLFADLLLPVPIPKLFTYRVPLPLNDVILPGQRVIVQFGDRKILTALVSAVHDRPPKDYEAKSILEILDEFPLVNPVQFTLFHWIADYYACTMGEVMNAALPAGLKLSSESMVQLHPAFNAEETQLGFSEKEWMLLKSLQHESLTYSDISKLLGVKYIHAILKSLTAKEAIILFEEVKEKYKPKTEKRIRLAAAYTSSEQLEEIFKVVESKPKQEAVLLKYLQDVPVLKDISANKKGISKKTLLAGNVSESSMETLIRNNILEEFETIIPRFGFDEPAEMPVLLLSPEQETAQGSILKNFETNNHVLLHGITGSGKTEIYINLIRKALDGGGQVLYLLPEIALTTQIVQRLKKIFGAAMGVYHSRFSDNERVEVWNGVVTGKLKFVVGVRSSVFLPFDNLGLIIVDEEHDSSYKQQEPAPRYNARDVAIMMGQFHHAKVLLGSATPSVETYYQALQRRYSLVTLDKRFGEAQLPAILLADMRIERQRKTVKGEFSSMMLRHIGEALNAKEQVIIFQNRRGYSPMVTCADCGWVPKCVNCAVSLTYHQFRGAVICHYCGYRETLPHHCPTCSSTRIQTVGYGTEKLEEELNLHFPEAVVQRMDLDTTRSKTGYETIIEQFEKGETDILVGTQMVTKGLDFNSVSLVGVFNADRMMHFPDFRSYERAFQLITQVSGRAGRRAKPGKVVIQTSSPEHTVLSHILENRFREFYEKEIRDRKEHSYPPFTRLIEVIVRHTDKKIARNAAHSLTDVLRTELKTVRTLGPEPPMISKIRNQFLMRTLIKIPRGTSDLSGIKMTIHRCIEQLLKEKEFRGVRVVIDVDPV
jgi:primosomal protein N' (replication factor Y) (superfamily II helicase)